MGKIERDADRLCSLAARSTRRCALVSRLYISAVQNKNFSNLKKSWEKGKVNVFNESENTVQIFTYLLFMLRFLQICFPSVFRSQ